MFLGRPTSTSRGELATDAPTRPVTGYVDTFEGTDLERRASGWSEVSADGMTRGVLCNLPWTVVTGSADLDDGELTLSLGATVDRPSFFTTGTWAIGLSALPDGGSSRSSSSGEPSARESFYWCLKTAS